MIYIKGGGNLNKTELFNNIFNLKLADPTLTQPTASCRPPPPHQTTTSTFAAPEALHNSQTNETKTDKMKKINGFKRERTMSRQNPTQTNFDSGLNIVGLGA